MSDYPTLPLKPHTIIIFPFTPSILLDPSPIISTIIEILPKSSIKSFTIIFTTPSTSIILSNGEEQLYTRLKQSPSAYFQLFQEFLSKIYGALATGQCIAGKLLMDVECHFDGEKGDWGDKLFRGEEGQGKAEREGYQVLLVEGVPIPPRIRSIVSSIPLITLPPIPFTSSKSLPSYPPLPGPEVVALGGTFDHLHAAHKLLLQLSSFLSTQKIIVGVISDSLLSTKKHHDLIEDLPTRLSSVTKFLNRLNDDESASKIELDISEIKDVYGPTKYEPNIQALVVSKETISGGNLVNTLRKEIGLNALEVFVVDVISDQIGLELNKMELELDEGRLKELKMGSTGIRKWIFENGQ